MKLINSFYSDCALKECRMLAVISMLDLFSQAAAIHVYTVQKQKEAKIILQVITNNCN